jgi:hypothetical protein
MIKYTAVLIPLVCCGCASQPTLYIYAKYLDENQKQKIKDKLQVQNYHIEFNSYDFPTSITQSTMLYSLLLMDPEVIDKAEKSLSDLGFHIARSQGLTEGNHWYTKNSIGVFLYPSTKDSNGPLFRQDLINHYEGQNCGDALSLDLKSDGFYQLSLANTDGKGTAVEEGRWRYRQYPYIELQKSHASYATDYFQIIQFVDSDKVSEIEFIKFLPLNSGHFSTGCAFLHGVRL